MQKQPICHYDHGHFDLHDEQDLSVKLCYIKQLKNISYKVCTSSALTLLRLGIPRLTSKIM